jgi:hypothetical protein
LLTPSDFSISRDSLLHPPESLDDCGRLVEPVSLSDHELGSVGLEAAFCPVCEQPTEAKPRLAMIRPALRNGHFMAHHLL